MKCKAKVSIWIDHGYHGKYIKVNCGDLSPLGGTTLCHKCEMRYEKLYPQGWNSYPGDVCKHGMYVGGCGIDWMCPQCELE